MRLLDLKDRMSEWSEHVPLEPMPGMSTLDRRSRDKWRVLVAIADYFRIGESVREMAIKIEAAEKKPYTNRQLLRSAAEALIEQRRLTFTDQDMFGWI
jgi:hypothetical protein